MKDFEIYKKKMLAQGVTISNGVQVRIFPKDIIQNGDELTIPKNVTIFTEQFHPGTQTYFVVFPNKYGDLKRVYLSWFAKPTTQGTVLDDLCKFVEFADFFTTNEGKTFKITFDISPEYQETPFGSRCEKNYSFDWVN